MSALRTAAAAAVLLLAACGGVAEPVANPQGASVEEVRAAPMSGRLAEGGWRVHGPIALEEARSLRVALQGDGAARLYVDVDAIPSPRDYVAATKLGAEVTVPATGHEAWLLVVADAETEYRIEATPVAPEAVKPHAVPAATFAGTLDAGRSAEHGPIPVTPGSTVVLTLDGSGDADLTARFDSAPTADEYDCLGISEGADSCTMVVPEHVSTLYVRVVAIQASEYLLDVTQP